jgi:hypothetical protein
MKYLLGAFVLLTMSIASALSDELNWHFGYRDDKLSDRKLPVAAAELAFGESKNNYLEISTQCNTRELSDPVYFEIIRISDDVNACVETGYSISPLLNIWLINYTYRVDDGPLLEGNQRAEYCNELKIPVSLQEGTSPASHFSAGLFRAKRLRIEVTLVHGEQPVIDISMRDAAIQKFVSSCEPLLQALQKPGTGH